MKNLVQREIKRLINIGATYVDIRVHTKDITESLSSCDGLLESHMIEKRFGFGVRVLINGAFGFCSMEDINCLEEASNFALNQAKNSANFMQIPIEMIQKEIFQDNYKTPTKIYPRDVQLKEKIDKLLSLAAPLQDQNFLHYGSRIGFYDREIYYADSEGCEITKNIIDVDAHLYVNAIDTEGLLQARTYNLYQNPELSVGFENLKNDQQINHGKRLRKELKSLLSAPSCEKEVCDVILLNEMMALQTHETIGHALELDRILGYELSFAGGSHVKLSDMTKLQFGSEKLNSFADGTTLCSPGTHGYDDEGVKGKNVQLIKDGILQNTISSRQSVVEANQKMGDTYFTESGGAGRAQSYNKLPIDRMNNINVAHGNDGDLQELIKKTQNGIILESPKSWSIGSNRENFHFACEIGFKIKDGEITNSVRNATYRGDSLPFWNSLDLVGSKETWQLQQVFQCGKGQPNQIMRLGHGVPICRFSNIEVGY
jgi:TldD protein